MTKTKSNKRYKSAVEPKNDNQALYLESLKNNKITFCSGPAGTGKTYLSAMSGILGLLNGEYHKLIISRPLVQSGENTGYLPGGINEKLDPYIKPIYDIFDYTLSKGDLTKLLDDKKIEIVPFAYMRGRNFFNSFIIFDEVQNCSYDQLMTGITRFSKNSKMVLNGDPTQSDLPKYKRGGFASIMDCLKDTKDIGIVEFDISNIIREPIVKTILEKTKHGTQDQLQR